MKRTFFITTALVLTAINLLSQDLFYKGFNWTNENWNTTELSEAKTILLNHEVIEFTFEGENFIEYYFYRQVEHINHDDEVEQNNKKYIPYSGASEIVEAKARVVKPDSSFIELDNSQILYSEDEETGRKYSFFALEGLEIGDVIDFYYVIKKVPGYHGNFTNIQSEYDLNTYRFELFAPQNLIFAFSLKNDTNKVVFDTTAAENHHWTLDLTEVPALKQEEEAPYGSLQKYIVYKLDENISTGTKNIVNYGVASQNIYANMYSSVDKDELKSLEKFLKKLKLDINAPVDTNIRKIEDYVKTNININEYADERFDNISFAIANRICTDFSMTKILVNAYKLKGIKHELVVTTDRSKKYFDEDFESFHNLDDYLIYFPETKGFLCPNIFEYRYPLIPAHFADNKGLFIKEVSLGEYKSGLGKVKYIDALPYKSTHHNMEIKASISEDFSQVDLQITQSGLGYYANYLQAFLDLISDDVYDNIGKDYLEGIMVDLESDNWTFENIGAHNMNKLPLLFICDAINKNMIEYAGNKYLFKVGDIIGPQMEMYSEDERELPLHDNYKREFVRHIEIEIPEGYEIKNPEDLVILTEYTKDGEQVLLFESSYHIEGATLMIDINEYYDQLYYTVEEYAYYRNVVNSASDFNKITLVIDKVE